MHPDPSGLGNNVSIRIMRLAHVEDPRLCGPTFSCILPTKAASTSDMGLRSELVPTTVISSRLTPSCCLFLAHLLRASPVPVSEASAANASDSSDLHIDAIQEEQATPWGSSKPIERANSARSSAGSLDDDMEWAVDLGWITSEAGTPSQFLESSVTTVVDDLQKPISYKAASQIVSPANTQQPTDIVLANDTKSESSAVVTAPLSPSSTGRPRISASSQSLYGLRDAVCRLLGNHQQDIARALSVSEDKTPNASRTANPVPAGESDSYDGSWWMLESDAALQAYIAG
ncbi:hypothetical protein COL940_013266 [Colletotrichum noveboracense]|nr:hypothetical protein COL940_013266 [Colletotrichum noveboracense]